MRTLPNLRLKLALIKRGLTQRDLSFETRIGEGKISRIIKGYEVPDDGTKRQIAEHLKLEAKELFDN